MQKKLKVIAGAGVALVVTGGAALAATTPDAAQDGLGRASEVAGIELPASQESHPTADDHPGGTPDTEIVEVEAPEVEAPEVEAPPAETHGATVSAVARDDSTTGAEHGAAVSAVARENGGAHAATPGTVPDQAADAGAEGAAHAEGRGRP
jgi:hypothetical protein